MKLLLLLAIITLSGCASTNGIIQPAESLRDEVNQSIIDGFCSDSSNIGDIYLMK
jgi:hypothetical protein